MVERNSKKRMLMLITNLNRTQVQHQQRAMSMMEAKNIPYDTIDGADPQNKEARNELFKLSGLRGVYPQFFLLEGEEKLEFLGDWDKIEALNDASSLPQEILLNNPSIMTWDKVMA